MHGLPPETMSMTHIVALSPTLPIIADAPPRTRTRFLEFFAANIRNANTRRPYAARRATV